MPDWYCPNCRQRVGPKLRPHLGDYIVGGAMYVGAPKLFSALGLRFGDWDWFAQVIAAVIVIAVMAAIWPQRSCPICLSWTKAFQHSGLGGD